jgi:tetratricopeptide (TPR) repeat protein
MLGISYVYVQRGDFDSALEYRMEGLNTLHKLGLQNTAEYVSLLNHISTLYAAKGEYDLAVSACDRAMELNPNSASAHNDKAWLLATCGNSRYRNCSMAVELAQRVVEIDPKVDYIDTLAAAYAESGKFDEAVKTQEMVIDLLKKEGVAGELDETIERLEGYVSILS